MFFFGFILFLGPREKLKIWCNDDVRKFFSHFTRILRTHKIAPSPILLKKKK